jgi:hypothetical protein
LTDVVQAFTAEHGMTPEQFYRTQVHPLQNASTAMLVLDFLVGDLFLVRRPFNGVSIGSSPSRLLL